MLKMGNSRLIAGHGWTIRKRVSSMRFDERVPNGRTRRNPLRRRMMTMVSLAAPNPTCWRNSRSGAKRRNESHRREVLPRLRLLRRMTRSILEPLIPLMALMAKTMTAVRITTQSKAAVRIFVPNSNVMSMKNEATFLGDSMMLPKEAAAILVAVAPSSTMTTKEDRHPDATVTHTTTTTRLDPRLYVTATTSTVGMLEVGDDCPVLDHLFNRPSPGARKM
mmetsp:Transcript_3960/g.6625  ORF Transcript_3960/g.6625 Transcript_3960/m.6625 type:complete len:221 (-) Transcript_3960:1537-2199(-)